MEPPIEISHSDVGDWTVVEICGEVDVYTVPTIKQFVIERLADGVRRFPRGDREKPQTLGRRLRRHRLRPSHPHAAPTSFPAAASRRADRSSRPTPPHPPTRHDTNVRTVEEPGAIREMTALGVDGVITDHPKTSPSGGDTAPASPPSWCGMTR